MLLSQGIMRIELILTYLRRFCALFDIDSISYVGGYELFSALYPFLRTQKIIYTQLVSTDRKSSLQGRLLDHMSVSHRKHFKTHLSV